MSRGIGTATLLGFWAATAAYPDTVTTTDHRSVNGILKQMANGVITLEARFIDGTEPLSIDIRAVESIGFNATTFNAGAPPKAPGIGPPKGSAPPEAPQGETTSNIIVLRGGQRKDCKLLGIDKETVRCVGKGREKGDKYNRRVVLRILVGAP